MINVFSNLHFLGEKTPSLPSASKALKLFMYKDVLCWERQVPQADSILEEMTIKKKHKIPNSDIPFIFNIWQYAEIVLLNRKYKRFFFPM